MIGLFVFNTNVLPNKYDVIYEYDYLTNANNDKFSISRCLTSYKTKILYSGEVIYGCDIIIDSDNDLELNYSNETFFCKRGIHYLPQWLSGDFGGNLQICENQKYKIYVLENTNANTDTYRKNDLMRILLRYRGMVYLEDFYSNETDTMIGHFAAYFGIVPNVSNRSENILDCFNFDDKVTYGDFLKYLEMGHFIIKHNKRKRDDHDDDCNDDNLNNNKPAKVSKNDYLTFE